MTTNDTMHVVSYLICKVWYSFKELQAVSDPEMKINYLDISKETLEEKNFKWKFYAHIFKGTIILLIMTTMVTIFIGISEDSDLQSEVLQFSQINVTEKPTTTMTTTIGKCSFSHSCKVIFRKSIYKCGLFYFVGRNMDTQIFIFLISNTK